MNNIAFHINNSKYRISIIDLSKIISYYSINTMIGDCVKLNLLEPKNRLKSDIKKISESAILTECICYINSNSSNLYSNVWFYLPTSYNLDLVQSFKEQGNIVKLSDSEIKSILKGLYNRIENLLPFPLIYNTHSFDEFKIGMENEQGEIIEQFLHKLQVQSIVNYSSKLSKLGLLLHSDKIKDLTHRKLFHLT